MKQWKLPCHMIRATVRSKGRSTVWRPSNNRCMVEPILTYYACGSLVIPNNFHIKCGWTENFDHTRCFQFICIHAHDYCIIKLYKYKVFAGQSHEESRILTGWFLPGSPGWRGDFPHSHRRKWAPSWPTSGCWKQIGYLIWKGWLCDLDQITQSKNAQQSVLRIEVVFKMPFVSLGDNDGKNHNHLQAPRRQTVGWWVVNG